LIERRRRVVIVDAGHGNLASVRSAFLQVGCQAEITTDPELVSRAPVLVFPGQGAAPAAMSTLESNGIGQALRTAISSGVPALGICLGMQLALDRSQEGPTPCLGLVRGECRRFEAGTARLKIPQIGWNRVEHRDDPLFAGIPSGTYFYFVHSYYCSVEEDAACGWTDYGIQFPSALRQGRFWATQFHPEKSAAQGLRLLSNFLALV